MLPAEYWLAAFAQRLTPNLHLLATR
ncbi:MAG: hypothetical protein RL341_533, partial [Pseudomonadota bacterium]